MAFTFRLHANGQNTNTDWQTCQPYGTGVIAQITAPNGATAKTEITSIPSPFARIALVKSAFGEVVNSGNLDGNTIYHKMVSDCLDVAEIFFNYDRLNRAQPMFNIVVWDAQADLASLQASHPQIYHSLDVFLKQDATVYNFNNMQRLYILEYVGPGRKTQMDVVGATSPASLFFTPANDLSYISPNVSFGQDHPFDGNYQPLYKRDAQLVEYLFAFRAAYSNFASLFPEVNAYLDKTYGALPAAVQQMVNNINPNTLASYTPLQINATNSVEILGAKLHKKPLQAVSRSDFFIAQSQYSGGLMPLVLPVERGNDYANLYYVSDAWGNQNAAPYSDPTPWQQRNLPADGTPHPYLTVGDFLEDTVFMVKQKANTTHFYFGEYDDTDNNTILLPLKPLFFKFYTVEQLRHGNNGAPMIKIAKTNGNNICVELHIPIAGGVISYTKNYFENPTIDTSGKRGTVEVISDDYFGIGMLPMVDADKPFNRVAIVHAFENRANHDIECYLKGELVNGTASTTRNKTDDDYLVAKVFSVDASPTDAICVCIGRGYGMIIPIYSSTKTNNVFSFAVDFGTTNTHIEYTVGSNASKAFDDKQLVFWSTPTEMTRQTLEENLMPEEIGSKFFLPTRTALSEAADTNWQQPVIPMAQTNISFVYGHRQMSDYNTITTDLKWSNDERNIARVRSYIENLMLIMRNKVLLEGGQLQNTKIVWFYPSSMSTARRNAYQQEWNDAYQKYFTNDLSNIGAVLESVAPYEFYRRRTAASSRMVTVDIGGGTTDVVFAENGQIRYTTSFRFAADSIFGDGYTQDGLKNGMVRRYVDKIQGVLQANGLTDLRDIATNMNVNGKSVDLASFFFSLKDDDEVVKKKAQGNLDWNSMLQHDNEFRVVFMLFYSAIIYHIAHIMKAKGLAMPRHIAFSGNGAKVLSVLSTSNKTIADYTKYIFCWVYGTAQYDADGLDIISTSDPKSATCKGGLHILGSGSLDVQAGENVVLLQNAHLVDPQHDVYKTLGEGMKKQTFEEVNEFLKFALTHNPRFSIKDKLGIQQSVLSNAMEVCKRDLMTYLEKGIEQKMTEVAGDDVIDETLFFYPIVGMLYALCDDINTKLN